MATSPDTQNAWSKFVISMMALLVAGVGIVLVATLLPRDKAGNGQREHNHNDVLQENEYLHAAVSSDVPVCSTMGRDILKAGGSAVDATITVSLCVGVVNPQSSGLGGGFFMTVYDAATNTANTLDAREPSPLATTMDLYDDLLKAKNGPLSICVPTELSGFQEAHRRYGSLPWDDLFQPVIELAENGFPMTDHTEYTLHFRNNRGQLTDPVLRHWYVHPNGTIKSAGDWIKRPDLARTLTRLAEDPDVFYEGDMAEAMVAELREMGSVISMDDFITYRPIWKEPHVMNLRNNLELLSPPLPSLGAILQFIVKAMDVYGVDSTSWADFESTVEAYHYFVEIQKFGNGFREHVGDSNSSSVQEAVRLMLSEEFIQETLKKITPDKVTYQNLSSYQKLPNTQVESDITDGDTSHISVLDEHGNAASLTTTVDWYFGSFIASNATGIVYNNHMADFRQETPNDIGAWKKSISSTCPSIVIDKSTDEVKLVVGTAGGRRIITTNAWIIIRTLFSNIDLKTAVTECRLNHPLLSNNYLDYQSGFPEDILERLEQLGHILDEERYRSSSTNNILKTTKGHVIGVSDARKGGRSDGY